MTPLEKLKAIAAAKKAAAQNQEVTSDETATVESVVPTTNEKPTLPVPEQAKEATGDEAESPSDVCEQDGEELSGGASSGLDDDHPLKMQLAELEQALTEKLPEFRTILRDIHSKLRTDPDCVTAMSEEEIGILVEGLIHHANVEVIAPANVKAAKKAAKTPVSASDL
jgi:hypothetical protein